MLDMARDIDDLDLADLFAEQLLADTAAGGLDALVARAYPDGGWEEYRDWIDYHGNPDDQIERFEAAGIILQPKQLEFCAWARRMDTNECIEDEQGTPELAIGGARGPGKSFVVFAQAVIDDAARFPGCKILYLRRVGVQAQEQLDDLKLSVLGHTKHHQTRGKIQFPNGSRMRIGHFKYEKDIYDYLGLGYEIIIIEEATTLSSKAHKAMRKANRTSMNMVPRIYNSTNPLGVWHQGYKKRFVLHERKHTNVFNRRRKFIQATVDDNLFINVDYVGNLEDDTGAELRAYRWGEWDLPAGAYFTVWNYDINTIEPISPAAHWPIWASMDYGFKHWNAIYFHTRYDGVEITFHELLHRELYAAEIAPDIVAALGFYGRSVYQLEQFLVGSDAFARRGEAKKTVAEQYSQHLGIKLTAALTAPGSRIAGAHHIARSLGNPKTGRPPNVLITRNCERLYDTIPSLERNPNNPEDVRKVDMSDDGEGGDDAYDGWRYGIFRKPPTSNETVTKKSGF